MENLIFEGPKLKIIFFAAPDSAKFMPVGTIDEDCNLGVILDAMTTVSADLRTITFNLNQVQRINSCGVREWVLMLDRLKAKKYQVQFEHVNELFVEQANLIPNLLGRDPKRVMSFSAPFYCTQCAESRLIE